MSVRFHIGDASVGIGGALLIAPFALAALAVILVSKVGFEFGRFLVWLSRGTALAVAHGVCYLHRAWADR